MFEAFDTNQLIAIAAVAVPAVLWLLDKYFGILGWLWRVGKKPEPTQIEIAKPVHVELQSPPVELNVETAPQPVDTMTLTIETYEAQVRARIAEAREQWEQAEGAERARLERRISDLEKKLTHIEPAYAEAKARVAEVEALLQYQREASTDHYLKMASAEMTSKDPAELDALSAKARLVARRNQNLVNPTPRLDKIGAALAVGSFQEADTLFTEMSEEADIGIASKAAAETGRAKVAEMDEDWARAEVHYARAWSIARAVLGEADTVTREVAAAYRDLLRDHFPEARALVELEAAFGPDIGKE